MASPWQHDVTSAGSRLPPWDREEKRRKFVCMCAVSSTCILQLLRLTLEVFFFAKVLAFEFHKKFELK